LTSIATIIDIIVRGFARTICTIYVYHRSGSVHKNTYKYANNL